MFTTREHVFGSISAYLTVLDLSMIMMIMGKDLRFMYVDSFLS